uniref:ABC transporter substrate-binding protein n=1 Tax=Prevotella sp. GTC17262 TaxID=3236797 RepID=A0AB33JP13_9BACT
MRKYSALFLLFTSLLLISCNGVNKQSTHNNLVDSLTTDTIHIDYAKGFSVQYLPNGVKLVDVKPIKTMKGVEEMPTDYKFALVPRDMVIDIPTGYTRIDVPINRCIAMTTLQLADFIALRALDKVSGITSTKNLFNQNVKQRIKSGTIVKIGHEGNFDNEKIMAADPQVIFISPFKRGGYDVVKQTGIVLIPHLGYKEETPLGQAEWLKFIGLFIDKEKEADSLFNAIAKRYEEARKLALNAPNKPTVMSGEIHSGRWFAVGGRNHLAQLFHDAGAKYILEHDKHSGGYPLEYEEMYAKGANADYWRILNSFKGQFTYEALAKSDVRNKDFKAWQQKHVIYCNMQQSPYYESSPVEPDVLLKDLIYIFHPESLQGYKPKYYQLLK